MYCERIADRDMEIYTTTTQREEAEGMGGERGRIFLCQLILFVCVRKQKREREILQNKKFVFHGPWILFKQQNYLFFLINIKISKFA